MTAREPAVDAVRLRFCSVPTATGERKEAETDGTARWSSTGVLLVEVDAGGETGLGYAYTTEAAFTVTRDVLVSMVVDCDPMRTTRAFWTMAGAVRNLGWPGIAASAISAVDIALHDLKSRLLGISLTRMLGGSRDRVMAYGSGGFTSYSSSELTEQLGGWAAEGLRAVKMKVGSRPHEDVARVAEARQAIGDGVALFVDANGAYSRKQALGLADRFAEARVSWFEEPVSSDDLDGLRLIRDRGPAGMEIAAGEYGYTPSYFHAMLNAGAVDTIQADATRCGGVTGFLIAAAEAQGADIPLSAHTSPALHASLGAALPNVVNVEYFHDHVRIERMLFDGVPRLDAGDLVPDPVAPGHGMTLKHQDATRYQTDEWDSGRVRSADLP